MHGQRNIKFVDDCSTLGRFNFIKNMLKCNVIGEGCLLSQETWHETVRGLATTNFESRQQMGVRG